MKKYMHNVHEWMNERTNQQTNGRANGRPNTIWVMFVKMKWNEWGFRPLLCTYRLNWARKTSWGHVCAHYTKRWTATQQTETICITFVQRRPNVFDVGPALYKCYTNVLCLLGENRIWHLLTPFQQCVRGLVKLKQIQLVFFFFFFFFFVCFFFVHV